MAYDPKTCADGPDSLHAHAWEPFFEKPTEEEIAKNFVNTSKVVCKESKIVPGARGVFAAVDIKKGEIVEWGIAVIIPGLSVHSSDQFYTWTSHDQGPSAPCATVSGVALFYNTEGDKSNCRCVPYHTERRFEVYALQDIPAGAELTIRYDSMNWRESMAEVRGIVGTLAGSHNQKKDA
mmetsp:Transcript_34411/g.97029  ORF Transcript_34411/g.97029 Transcript_34411/m.97029 type:complete len:179 (-) Transcript_34411:198-734(-)